MELVPIIYTSLLIVATLTVFVISFSYLSYKIRQKRGEEIPAYKIVKPIIKAETSVKHIVERITKNFQHQKPVVKKHIIDSEINKNIKHREHQNTKRDKVKEDKPKQKIKRIEVVKSSNPTSPKTSLATKLPLKDSADKNTVDKKLESLGDKILDKYADEESKDMFVLNTKKNKKDDKR